MSASGNLTNCNSLNNKSRRQHNGQWFGKLGLTTLGMVVGLMMAMDKADAAYVGGHSGKANTGCLNQGNLPLNIANPGSDNVTLTCANSNPDDTSIDVTVFFDTNFINNTYNYNVALTPSGNINFSERLFNSTGQNWTGFTFDFEVPNRDPGFGFKFGSSSETTPQITFDAGDGSLDSFSFDVATQLLTLNFFNPVTSGNGFDLSFVVNYNGGGNNACGSCQVDHRPNNEFTPDVNVVPLPAALPLFLGALAGLGGLGALKRRRKAT